MKKVACMLVLAGVMAMAGQAWAGSGCYASCGAKKSKEWSDCNKGLSGIELTADQQTKVDAIKAECEAAGMTKEACASSMSKIRDVLTDEQKAQYDAASRSSKKSSGGGCGG